MGLTMGGVTKHFGGVAALSDVSLDLRLAEVHCLVGENGAGKSTLMKVLSGALQPDVGEVQIDGRSVGPLSPASARAHGISIVYQDAHLVDSLTVADNVFLGNELKTRAGFIDRQRQVDIVDKLMSRLGIDLDPNRLVDRLSAAQRQMLQIARAVHHDVRFLVLDEPTASLSAPEVRKLMTLVRDLRGSGTSVIYISHFIHEVLEIGDRVTVLKDGRTVASRSVAVTTADEIVRDMVGRDASNFYERVRATVGEVALEVVGLTKAPAVRNVSFEVRRGEVFGLGGIVGSGRTELARLLFGADRRDGGVIRLDGRDVTPSSPARAIAAGICMVPEDRLTQALCGGRDVRENMEIAQSERRGGWLRHGAERREVADQISTLRIATAGDRQDIATLSGGNQQKVVLGRWLIVDADVYIFDEPTRGVDVGATHEIYGLISHLAARGKVIIMISSDLPELIAMSDRIGVMRAGELVDVVEQSAATEEQLVQQFVGVS
ncbi:sugar ABC transporter ATP-binding protein [soil metagenome]